MGNPSNRLIPDRTWLLLPTHGLDWYFSSQFVGSQMTYPIRLNSLWSKREWASSSLKVSDQWNSLALWLRHHPICRLCLLVVSHTNRHTMETRQHRDIRIFCGGKIDQLCSLHFHLAKQMCLLQLIWKCVKANVIANCVCYDYVSYVRRILFTTHRSLLSNTHFNENCNNVIRVNLNIHRCVI